MKKFKSGLRGLRLSLNLFLLATLSSAARADDGAAAPRAAPVQGNQGSAVVGKDSTNIDFSAANIDGKMQAPSGFFLQGRQAQSMTQMVKLRANFRGELRNSKSAVKDLVK